MDQQGVGRAVLLGNSLGPIIVSLLDDHIDRTETIVMVSPAGGLYNLPIDRGVAQMALAGPREPPRMFEDQQYSAHGHQVSVPPARYWGHFRHVEGTSAPASSTPGPPGSWRKPRR